MALLKYGKYIEKLKLTAQTVHMQITMILYRLCVNRMIEGLNLLCSLKNFKSFALLLWSTVRTGTISCRLDGGRKGN